MTVMAKTTFEEICENAKLARDMALTGNYDSACIYYEGLQGLLARQLKATADPLRKGKWSMVRHSYRHLQILSTTMPMNANGDGYDKQRT